MRRRIVVLSAGSHPVESGAFDRRELVLTPIGEVPNLAEALKVSCGLVLAEGRGQTDLLKERFQELAPQAERHGMLTAILVHNDEDAERIRQWAEEADVAEDNFKTFLISKQTAISEAAQYVRGRFRPEQENVG